MTVLFEHGGNLYQAIRQKGGFLEDLLDFSANINPVGLPESVRLAVISGLPDVIHYPDSEARALKDAIARRYKVDRNLITTGNGAAELLYVLCHMLHPKRVVVAAPTFSEYERAARAAGADVAYMHLDPADMFTIEPTKIIRNLQQADILFLGNPNNPTGQVLTRSALEPVIASARSQHCLVVVDESFIDFMQDAEEHTCRPLLATYPNLLILQSMTKYYAIPGLRLGFMIADAAIGKILDLGKDPWNVNLLAQVAGVAALADKVYQDTTETSVAAARQIMFHGLQQIPGFKPLPSVANFMLVDITGTGVTAPRLRRAMLEHNILIRDCSNFRGLSPQYIRLAVKLPEQNDKLIQTFKTLIKGSDLIDTVNPDTAWPNHLE